MDSDPEQAADRLARAVIMESLLSSSRLQLAPPLSRHLRISTRGTPAMLRTPVRLA